MPGARKPRSVLHSLPHDLAVHTSSSKSKATFDLYSQLNLALTRSIAEQSFIGHST